MSELWLIYDSRDGEQIVIESEDYVRFCTDTDRNHWGFEVRVIELGEFSHDLTEVDTHALNCKVDDGFD